MTNPKTPGRKNPLPADMHTKVPFIWHEPAPAIAVPARLRFRTLDDIGLAALIDAVARVMSDSLDLADRRHVDDLGAHRAAETFIAEAAEDFDYRPEWWHMAFDQGNTPVGFVLPVLFQGNRKGDLNEGTIYYLGVVPEQRGHNYGHDLLCQGTSMLQRVGVWQIYCDTDVLNEPMIRAFERAGYQQDGPPYSRPLYRPT